jgi:ATP-dependent RNA helicase DDX19/DBP5
MLSRVNPNLQQPQALCVSPTRELAMQTYEVLTQLAKYTQIQPFLLIPDVVSMSFLLSSACFELF